MLQTNVGTTETTILNNDSENRLPRNNILVECMMNYVAFEFRRSRILFETNVWFAWGPRKSMGVWGGSVGGSDLVEVLKKVYFMSPPLAHMAYIGHLNECLQNLVEGRGLEGMHCEVRWVPVVKVSRHCRLKKVCFMSSPLLCTSHTLAT